MNKDIQHSGINADRVALLYKNTFQVTFAIIVLASLLAGLLWPHAGRSALVAWLAAIFVSVAVRLLLVRSYRRQQPASEQPGVWERRYLWTIFLSGILWGLAPLLPASDAPYPYVILVLFVLVGLCGGAMASYATSRLAYPLFVIPVTLPFVFRQLLGPSGLEQAMGAMVLLFVVLTIIISRQAYRIVSSSLAVGYEKASLLKALQRSHRELSEQHEQHLQAGSRLREAKGLLDQIFATTPVLFAHMDSNFNFLQVNQSYAETGGYPVDYFPGKNHFDLYPDEENEAIFTRVIRTGEPYVVKAKPFEHPELGTSYWDWSLQPIKGMRGEVSSLLLTVINVTDHKRVEMEVREKEAYLNSIMQTAADGIVTTDARGTIEMANAATAKLFGYPLEELIGKNVDLFMPEEFAQRHAAIMHQHTEASAQPKLQARTIESKGRCRDGVFFPLEITISETLIQDRRIFTGIFRDITAKKQALLAVDKARHQLEEANRELERRNKELQRLSTHDALTGIANRRSFDGFYDEEWKRAIRNGSELVVILIDIDHFKAYNDYYGHQQGDLCLQKVAALLAGCVQRPADHIARYGGEEFVVILPETDWSGACHLANEMCRVVEEAAMPHEKSATAPYVTISVGVASAHPNVEERAEALISMADKELYRAKQQGRNRVVCMVSD